MKHLKLAAIETHVADARTCCLHPATATHRQMNDEELAAAGVSRRTRALMPAVWKTRTTSSPTSPPALDTMK